jgi:UMF1 family MFS transporter
MKHTTIKNNPKIMKAFYDWANSVYSLVITSTIFPIYYSIITTAYEKNEFVAETGKMDKSSCKKCH